MISNREGEGWRRELSDRTPMERKPQLVCVSARNVKEDKPKNSASSHSSC